ncbi:cell wall-associated NlpC family hydrolase [Robbsia andropogonis]|uniref:C40 family peptidase n=1 Tax=Robbsia andropogonis TaxID=28092 RepID=UPI003D1B209D
MRSVSHSPRPTVSPPASLNAVPARMSFGETVSDAMATAVTTGGAAFRLAASSTALACLLILGACGTTPRDQGNTSADASGVRTKLNGWGPKTPPPGLPKFVDHSVGQEEISMQAMGLVGIPYRWGGNTPASGFDCSGLVRYVVDNAADVQLPRTTSQMRYAGTSVEPDEIAPGDLVFFNTDGRPYSHVGVYVGNYRFVNAPSTGGTVRIDYISNPYWARHFDGIRRIAGRRATAPVPLDPRAPLTPQDGQPMVAPENAYAQAGMPAGNTTNLSTAPAAPINTPPPSSQGVGDDPIGAVIAHADRQGTASVDPIARIAAQAR